MSRKNPNLDLIDQDYLSNQLLSLKSRLALWLDSVRAVPHGTAVTYQSEDLVENLGDLLEQIVDLQDEVSSH